jgi:DNA-binding transcriptional ArsR family regulator
LTKNILSIKFQVMEAFKVLEQQDLGALASPFRQQLLEELKEEPASASHIARRHDMSRQRVGYHMRELVKAGYLEIASERQQRGLKEQLYRVRSFVYVHAGMSEREGRSLQDRFSWATLLNQLAAALGDLVSIRRLADAQDKRVATLGLESEIRFASPAERRAFSEELILAVENLVEKYHSEDAVEGRSFNLLLGAWPVMMKENTRESEREEERK